MLFADMKRNGKFSEPAFGPIVLHLRPQSGYIAAVLESVIGSCVYCVGLTPPLSVVLYLSISLSLCVCVCVCVCARELDCVRLYARCPNNITSAHSPRCWSAKVCIFKPPRSKTVPRRSSAAAPVYWGLHCECSQFAGVLCCVVLCCVVLCCVVLCCVVLCCVVCVVLCCLCCVLCLRVSLLCLSVDGILRSDSPSLAPHHTYAHTHTHTLSLSLCIY